MNLGEVRQEAAGTEERAITCTDDPHIKVLFSSTHKSRDSSLGVFLASLSGWEAGLNSVFQPRCLRSFHLA